MSPAALWLIFLCGCNGALGLLIARLRVTREILREVEQLRAAAARELEQAMIQRGRAVFGENSKADRGRACMPARVPGRSQ